jgi:hypothetical protein
MSYDPTMKPDDPRRYANPGWDAMFGQPVGGWVALDDGWLPDPCSSCGCTDRCEDEPEAGTRL